MKVNVSWTAARGLRGLKGYVSCIMAACFAMATLLMLGSGAVAEPTGDGPKAHYALWMDVGSPPHQKNGVTPITCAGVNTETLMLEHASRRLCAQLKAVSASTSQRDTALTITNDYGVMDTRLQSPQWRREGARNGGQTQMDMFSATVKDTQPLIKTGELCNTTLSCMSTWGDHYAKARPSITKTVYDMTTGLRTLNYGLTPIHTGNASKTSLNLRTTSLSYMALTPTNTRKR